MCKFTCRHADLHLAVFGVQPQRDEAKHNRAGMDKQIKGVLQCIFVRIEKHPAQPIAKQNVPDASRVLQRISLPLFYHKGRGFTYKALSLSKNQILGKKEVKIMSFFTTAVTGLKTVVTAIGAGVAVWGVINLLEGYGNDNPGANAHVR